MKIKFRKVVQSDLDKFPLWYKRIGGDQLFTHFIPSTYRINEESDHLHWYVILSDDDEIGTIWIELKDEIKMEFDLGIYLNQKKYLGKGIGKTAIQQFIEFISSRLNINEVFLNVRKLNQRAVKCYKGLGFEKIQEGEIISASNRIEFIRMRREI